MYVYGTNSVMKEKVLNVLVFYITQDVTTFYIYVVLEHF